MKYFNYYEFFDSAVADSVNLANFPSPDQLQFVRGNIMLLVDHVLDPIQEHVRELLYIKSGYRCEQLNDLIRGSEDSQHLTGRAADFTIDGFCAKDYKILAYWCADNLDFDQLIVHAKQKFIHISYVSPESNRHEVLFI